ncbi:MAG: hypothetical protein AB7F43_04690 [Bacteriovoracia bacterium]
MLLSGFTFIRNAEKYDFPIQEAIESMLPIVDELVINVGNSADNTLDLIQNLSKKNEKIRLIQSQWDDEKVKDGLVLSEQTNIALDQCNGLWALYLQADEAIHEREHAYIRQEVELEQQQQSPVEALRFKYLHFYSGYTLVQRTKKWYPNEIRIIRKNSGAKSFGDAQTFRGPQDRLLRYRDLDAHIFHYGHAREPEKMKKKIHYFHRFWHGDNHQISTASAYDISQLRNLCWYTASHPQPYLRRVTEAEKWSIMPSQLIREYFDLDNAKRIVVVAHRSQRELVELVKANLKQTCKNLQFIEIFSPASWVKLVARNFWKNLFWRKQTLLLDLGAESRNCFIQFFWQFDARWISSYRIGFSPQGFVSKLRSKVYQFIVWGRSEAKSGFVFSKPTIEKSVLCSVGVDQVVKN